jgi:hypothetical protein
LQPAQALQPGRQHRLQQEQGLQRALPQPQEPLRAQEQVQVPEPPREPGPGQLLPSCRRQTEPRQRPGKPTGAMFSLIPLRDFCE